MGLLIAASYATLIAWALPASILSDGGFEAGLDRASSWRLVRRSGPPAGRAVTTEPHGGAMCVQLETRATGDEVALAQVVAVEPTKHYGLSFFVAGELDGARLTAMVVFRG